MAAIFSRSQCILNETRRLAAIVGTVILLPSHPRQIYVTQWKIGDMSIPIFNYRGLT